MTIVRGLTITIASMLVFGCMGASLGYVLGWVAPDYYRVVFGLPPEVALDPTQLGLGLGVTQGLGAGLIIGLVIVVSVSWYNSRIAASSSPRALGREE